MARAQKATAMLVVDDRQFIGGLLRAEKRFRGFQKKTSKLGKIGKALGGVGGGLGGSFGVGLGFAAVGAAAGVAVKGALDFDAALTDLDIASNGAVGSLDQVRRRVLDVSKDTGVGKEDILAGAAAFVRLTGDGKAAAESMQTFARVQKATGASMDDIAGTAAAMTQQFGIAASEYEQAFSILVAGGKAGAIEMRQMAEFSAELAAQFKNFEGGKGISGLADMSAAFQIAARDFGGKAAETATGLQRLFGAFTTKRTIKELKKLGVEVFNVGKDGTRTLKSFPEIMDAMAQTDIIKDPRLLTKIFESSEARRAAGAILKNRDAFRELAAATRIADDVASDYAKRQASGAARVEKSWNNLRVAVAEAFTPERIAMFATAIENAVQLAMRLGEALGDVLSIFSDDKKGRDERAGQTVDALVKGGAAPEDIQLGKGYEFGGGLLRVPSPETMMQNLAGMTSGVSPEELRRKARERTFDNEAMDARLQLLRRRVVDAVQPAPGVVPRDTPTGEGAAERLVRLLARELKIKVGLDKDTNLKAGVDNHRSQARTP